MGLDMYLTGEKYVPSNSENPDSDPRMDGFRIKQYNLELGYWRKHPNLHGYIVQEFAEGIDECQDIDLDKDQLKRLINAVKARELPKTEGFFFGSSDGSDEEIAEDVRILEGALAWLVNDSLGGWRSVTYRASW